MFLRGCAAGPLALSRFLRRGAVPACKNRSAAPASPRCFCRRQRSAQLPHTGALSRELLLLLLALPELSGAGGCGCKQPAPRRNSFWFRAPVKGRGRRPGVTSIGRWAGIDHKSSIPRPGHRNPEGFDQKQKAKGPRLSRQGLLHVYRLSGSSRWVARYSRGDSPWTFLKAREKCSWLS